MYGEIATTYTEERERENGRPKDDGEEATVEEGRKLYILLYTYARRIIIYTFTEKGLCAAEVPRRGQ